MSKKFVACLLLLAACSSTPPAPKPVAVRPLSKPPVHQLPASLIGEDRQQQEALQAFLNSCPQLGMRWQSLCWQAQRTPKTPAAAARFFQQNFDEYALAHGTGLLTGYMEAQLRCSWQPTARFNYPVYGTPSDLR